MEIAKHEKVERMIYLVTTIDSYRLVAHLISFLYAWNRSVLNGDTGNWSEFTWILLIIYRIHNVQYLIEPER